LITKALSCPSPPLETIQLPHQVMFPAYSD
jgi:hypothetical protein